MPTAQRKARGLTLGTTIFLRVELDVSSESVMSLVLHETVHVAQAHRFGHWGMARRYGVEFARAGSYSAHPLEIEAKAHQKASRDALGAAVRAHQLAASGDE